MSSPNQNATNYEDFFACAGESRAEEHTLPNGKVVWIGEMGGDEWVEIEAETMRARTLNGKDPLLDARVIVRSVMNADKAALVFFRPILNGDKNHDKAELARYEEQLKKIMKMPWRVFKPLMDKVNRVNFADEASYLSLKKKSETDASAGSSSLPETPGESTSER